MAAGAISIGNCVSSHRAWVKFTPYLTAIDYLNLLLCLYRYDRDLELLDTGNNGTRVQLSAPDREVWGLWVACFRLFCNGRLDSTVREDIFSVATVRESNGRGQHISDPDDAPIQHLGLFCPDFTRISHPRRPSLSELDDLEIETHSCLHHDTKFDKDYIARMSVETERDSGEVNMDLARTTFSSHEALSWRPVYSDDTVVVDFGTYSMKSGRAVDRFPIGVTESRHPENTAGTEQHRWLVSGDEVGHSRLVDWDGVDQLFHAVLDDQMNINMQQHSFVVTEPPDARGGTDQINGKQHLAELLLEQYEVPRIAMQSQAELGMRYSGRTTGLAVSVGDRLSIVPFVDGYVLWEYAFEADWGGRQLSQEWHRLAADRYGLHDDSFYPDMHALKHSHGFVAPTYETRTLYT